MTVVDLGAGEVHRAPQDAGLTAEQAEALGARVMAAASDVARQEAAFLQLVGEFDAAGGYRWWVGVKSTAHWLSWACSIAANTAREHVRVARALRRMPKTRAAFSAGELTFSKVREMTRLVDRAQPSTPHGVAEREDAETKIDEEGLITIARACTASQLSRTLSAYRAAEGTSRHRRSRQKVSWVTDEEGNVHLTAILPPEVGAAVIAAVRAAVDAGSAPEPQPGAEQPDDRVPGQSSDDAEQEARERSKVEALQEVANHYLASRPEDRSGEDRTMVVFEVNAAALDSAEDASAEALSQTCRIRGFAAVEPSTARAALCDSPLLGVLLGDAGEPLAVGREHRLVTRAQRRALMVRDGCCQFPGCTQSRRLKAHHRVSWMDGGPTDLQNLILLCQWHHTRVHEEQIAIAPCAEQGCGIPWRFSRRDGSTIAPKVVGIDAPCPWRPGRGEFRRRNDELVAVYDAEQAALRDQAADLESRYGHIHDTRDPQACKVFPVGGGAGFQLVDCVTAVFNVTTPNVPATAA